MPGPGEYDADFTATLPQSPRASFAGVVEFGGQALELLAGAAGRQTMGLTARTRARRLYSVDAMCEATLKVYARVLRARVAERSS